jgi:hypothetical protein
MMNFFKGLRSRVENGLGQNLDLLALWVLLIALQPQIPIDHILAREDLVPWLMFCLATASLFRGRRYGDGPHTSLTKQQSGFGAWLRRGAMVSAPIVLVFWFDLGFHIKLVIDGDALQYIVQPLIYSTLVLIALFMSAGHERTSWNPPGIPSALVWLAGGTFVVISAVGIGYIESLFPQLAADALLLGLGFFATGSIVGRVRHLRQRRAAGTKDGRSYYPKLFNYLFSGVGAVFGLWALYLIQERIGLGGKVAFEQAFVPAAFVVAWAGVVWPKPIPIAVTCLLHEVMPSGGGEKSISTTANPFDKPPEGALRINPLRIKRIRSTHPWLVPVKASRVPELDDPIRPLWPRREAPLAFHVLGNASFEPNTYTNQEQWTEITIRLKGSDDVGSVSGSAAGNKSLVVLKPFLRPGVSRKKRLTTYRWDKPVPQASVQNVDATTESLSLENGSIIVLATEGVARAFEVEIGTPIYRLNDAAGFRPPQLEDYVKV